MHTIFHYANVARKASVAQAADDMLSAAQLSLFSLLLYAEHWAFMLADIIEDNE